MTGASLTHTVRQYLRRFPVALRVVRSIRAAHHRLAESWITDALLAVMRYPLRNVHSLGPPRGTFSAYAMVLEHQTDGEVLLEGQEVGPIPATDMRIVSGLNQDRHQPWPIFWTRHTNARLAGTTLVLIDDEKRACFEAMYVDHYPRDPAYRSARLPRPIRLSGNWTSVVSRWTRTTNFYHWLTDAVPRLALIDRLPTDVRVLTPPQLQPFQVQTLEWLGLAGRFRPTPEKHVIVENYFFSPPTAMTGCTNPYAVRFLRSSFLTHADSNFGGDAKLYITRSGKKRGIINEDDVLALLRKHGWESIDPETLSLSQQITLFASARAICGPHGAGLTNIVWCAPDCTVIELIADNYLNGCFRSISSCIGIEHHYLVFPGDHDARINVALENLEPLIAV